MDEVKSYQLIFVVIFQKGLFSVQLYNYMMQHHEVTDEQIKNLLREIICFDDGTCVDIGDVGIHPFM